MNEIWKFDDVPDVACITTVDVLDHAAVITDVYHDYGGGWQFLNDRDEPFGVDDARVVSLGCMVEMDGSIQELSNLDYGWRAVRDSRDSDWEMEKNHPYATFEEAGYYLEDVDWIAEFLDDVNPPPMEQREELSPDHWCKLIFRFRDEMSEREDYDSERMWIVVTEVDDHDYYTGVLQNTPAKNEGLKEGDEVRFHPTHIMEIQVGE